MIIQRLIPSLPTRIHTIPIYSHLSFAKLPLWRSQWLWWLLSILSAYLKIQCLNNLPILSLGWAVEENTRLSKENKFPPRGNYHLILTLFVNGYSSNLLQFPKPNFLETFLHFIFFEFSFKWCTCSCIPHREEASHVIA